MGGKRTLRYEPVKAIIDETREQFGNEQRIDRNAAPICRRLNHQPFTTSHALKANYEPRFYDKIVLIPLQSYRRIHKFMGAVLRAHAFQRPNTFR